MKRSYSINPRRTPRVIKKLWTSGLDVQTKGFVQEHAGQSGDNSVSIILTSSVSVGLGDFYFLGTVGKFRSDGCGTIRVTIVTCLTTDENVFSSHNYYAPIDTKRFRVHYDRLSHQDDYRKGMQEWSNKTKLLVKRSANGVVTHNKPIMVISWWAPNATNKVFTGVDVNWADK